MALDLGKAFKALGAAQSAMISKNVTEQAQRERELDLPGNEL